MYRNVIVQVLSETAEDPKRRNRESHAIGWLAAPATIFSFVWAYLVLVTGLVVVEGVGCTPRREPSRSPRSQLPLCFVEQRFENKMFIEHIGNTHPMRFQEVLLMPYFSVRNSGTGQFEQVVARPFLYRPETPLNIPDYRPGYGIRGLIALCPGCLPDDVPAGFYYTDQISGTPCQLVDVVRARSEDEANRVLLDFKYLLSQEQIVLGQVRNPLEIRPNEEYVYSLSAALRTPPQSKEFISCAVWNYEPGTKLFVDLTAPEIKAVNDFFDRYLKPTSTAGKVQPVLDSSEGKTGQ